MKTIATLSLMCLVLIMSLCVAYADEQDIFQSPAWQEEVTMDIVDMPFGKAMDSLMKSTGISYSVDPEIKVLLVRSLSLCNVPRVGAFKSLIKLLKLSYRIDNNTIIVEKKPGENYPWIKRVNVDVKNAQLNTVLPDMFNSVGLSFILDPNAAKLVVKSLQLTDVPFTEALDKVLNDAGAYYYGSGDMVEIKVKQASSTMETLFAAVAKVTVVRKDENKDPWLVHMDVEIKGAPLSIVIEKMLDSTPLNFSIDQDIAQLNVGPLKLNDVTLSETFNKILSDAGAFYYIDQNTVKIKPKQTPSATAAKVTVVRKDNNEDPWLAHIDIETNGAPFNHVIEEMFKSTRLNFSIARDLKYLTASPIKLNDVTFTEAVNKILDDAGATYEIKNGVVMIKLKSVPAAASELVSIQMKDISVAEAIKALFKCTTLNYAIAPNIGQLRVTMTLKNIPFYAALDSLVKAAGLMCSLDGNVYQISARPDATIAPAPENSKPTAPSKVQAKTPGKEISLNMEVAVTRKGQEKKVLVNPIVITREGMAATMSVTTEDSPKADGSKQVLSSTTVLVKPTMRADGKILISGTAEYIDGFSNANFGFTTLLEPGKPKTMHSINMLPASDKTKADLDLILTLCWQKK